MPKKRTAWGFQSRSSKRHWPTPPFPAGTGSGVVVQAYGRRAGDVIDGLYDIARRLDRRIMVRLVKGAYWDTEIKHAQVA